MQPMGPAAAPKKPAAVTVNPEVASLKQELFQTLGNMGLSIGVARAIEAAIGNIQTKQSIFDFIGFIANLSLATKFDNLFEVCKKFIVANFNLHEFDMIYP